MLQMNDIQAFNCHTLFTTLCLKMHTIPLSIVVKNAYDIAACIAFPFIILIQSDDITEAHAIYACYSLCRQVDHA